MILTFQNIPANTTKSELQKDLEGYGVKGIIKKGKQFYVRIPKNEGAYSLIEKRNLSEFKGNQITVKPIRSVTNLSVCRTSLGMIRMF